MKLLQEKTYLLSEYRATYMRNGSSIYPRYSINVAADTETLISKSFRLEMTLNFYSADVQWMEIFW